MKWKVIPLVLVLGAMVATPFLPGMAVRTLPQVEVATPTVDLYTDTVNGSGLVEENDRRSVYFELPVLVGEVYVQPGDEVEEGQVVAKVNRSATKDCLLNAASVSAMLSNSLPISQDTIKSVMSKLNLNSLDDLSEDLLPEKVVAPAAGKITQLNLSKTNLSNPSDPVLVVELSPQKIARVNIPEQYASQIKSGQKAKLTGVGFGDVAYDATVLWSATTAKRIYEGTVPQTVIEVTLQFDDANADVKPNLTANAEIFVSNEQQTLMVPYEAVLQDKDNTEYVYILENGRAVRRDITTGVETEEGTGVTEGITGTDLIIQNPSAIERSGQLVVATMKGA